MMYSLKRWSIPTKAMPYLATFHRAEREFGLPKNILVRMAQQESNFNPLAENPSGAKGMMQIIPRWHPDLKDPFDPYESIYYAGRYMSELFKQFYSWRKALGAYNWGPGNVKKHGLGKAPEETRNYIKDITGDIGMG